MNPMDPGQEQRVWSRVMNAQTAAPATPAARADTPMLTDKMVLQLIQDELHDCVTYRDLARRMHGCDKGILSQLAEQEHCHSKRLTAIYFLMTGLKPCPDRPKPACVTCINETLRQRYEEELAASENYAAIAGYAGKFACIFQEIAHDECCHAQQILCLLQNCL